MSRVEFQRSQGGVSPPSTTFSQAVLETSPQGVVGAAGRKQVDDLITVSTSQLSRIPGNHRGFRTNSAPTSPTNRFWHPRQPQRAPRAWGTPFTAMLWARALGMAVSVIGSQCPRRVCVPRKRSYQTPQNSKGEVGTIYILQNIRFSARILNITNFQCGAFTESSSE